MREMMTTPNANIPTKRSPIDVSSPRTVCRLTNSIANTMTAAAIAAPTSGFRSKTTAAAIPGMTP